MSGDGLAFACYSCQIFSHRSLQYAQNLDIEDLQKNHLSLNQPAYTPWNVLLLLTI